MFVHDWGEFESAGLSETTEYEVANKRDIEISRSWPLVDDFIKIKLLCEIPRLYEHRNERDKRHSSGDEKECLTRGLCVDLEPWIPLILDPLLLCTASHD